MISPIPAVLILAWSLFVLMVCAEKDGKPTKVCFATAFWTRCVSLAVLYWGGFFDVLFR